MKIAIMGHARHGKDSAAKILCNLMKKPEHIEGSFILCERFIYPMVGHLMGYKSIRQCWNDRDNHRALWYEMIKAINHTDAKRAANTVFDVQTIYTGIRTYKEYHAIKHDLDACIWVDASKRLPLESPSSNEIQQMPKECIYLDNNGEESLLREQVLNLHKKILQPLFIQQVMKGDEVNKIYNA